MTSLRLIRLQDMPSRPWANGGGMTRELLAWPDADDWQLRLSVARIDRDGPFSAFPGIQRWFVVLEGAGVELALPGGQRQLRTGDEPWVFDGASAPGCRLLQGPTLDLNLMSRCSSGRARLLKAHEGCAWTEPAAWRGVYITRPAVLSGAGVASRLLDAHTLAFSTDAAQASWQLHAAGGATPSDGASAVAGWWICHEPLDDKARPS